MSLLLATLVLVMCVIVGWIMLIIFPRVLPALVDFQAQTPGTEGIGGHGEFHLWLLVFAAPLLFLALAIVVAFMITMREEAHRARF